MKRLGLHQVDQSGAVDGEVPTWDDTSGLWVPGAGGGSSAPAFALDDRTLDPTHGVHFDTPTLDKFTRRGSAVSGDEQHQMGGGTWMQIDTPRAAGSYYTQPAPSGDFSVVMKYFWNFTGNAMSGPIIVDDTGAGVAGLIYASSEGFYAGHLGANAIWDSAGNAFVAARMYVAAASSVPIWVKLTKTGGNYKTAVSLNGQCWSKYTGNYTPAGFTPTRIGFGPSLLASPNTPVLFGIDWFDVE